MNEDRAARYQRLRRRAVLLAAGATLLLLVLLSATGAAHALSRWAEGLAGRLAPPGWLQSWISTFIFVSVLVGLYEAVSLPFAAYHGHVLDRRYGLSRLSWGRWAWTHAKAIALGWGVSLVSGGILMACLRLWPGWWWAPAWGASALASVIAAWAGPVWIAPLFFTIAPLRHETLVQCLSSLAAKAGVPVLGVFEWRTGDQTSRAGAALAGLGSSRRILVSDTLVADFAADEVEVVLAHELSHHVHRDIWMMLGVQSAIVGVSLWVTSRLLPPVVAALGLAGPGDLAALPAVVLLVVGVWSLGRPVAHACARRHERRADRFALELTGKPEAFVRALRRLGARNLTEDDPPRLARLLFATHPALTQRIAVARSWGRAQGDGGRPATAP